MCLLVSFSFNSNDSQSASSKRHNPGVISVINQNALYHRGSCYKPISHPILTIAFLVSILIVRNIDENEQLVEKHEEFLKRAELKVTCILEMFPVMHK